MEEHYERIKIVGGKDTSGGTYNTIVTPLKMIIDSQAFNTILCHHSSFGTSYNPIPSKSSLVAS